MHLFSFITSYDVMTAAACESQWCSDNLRGNAGLHSNTEIDGSLTMPGDNGESRDDGRWRVSHRSCDPTEHVHRAVTRTRDLNDCVRPFSRLVLQRWFREGPLGLWCIFVSYHRHVPGRERGLQTGRTGMCFLQANGAGQGRFLIPSLTHTHTHTHTQSSLPKPPALGLTHSLSLSHTHTHTGKKMLGCFNPIVGQIWTNSNIGLKIGFKF